MKVLCGYTDEYNNYLLKQFTQLSDYLLNYSRYNVADKLKFDYYTYDKDMVVFKKAVTDFIESNGVWVDWENNYHAHNIGNNNRIPIKAIESEVNYKHGHGTFVQNVEYTIGYLHYTNNIYGGLYVWLSDCHDETMTAKITLR